MLDQSLKTAEDNLTIVIVWKYTNRSLTHRPQVGLLTRF